MPSNKPLAYDLPLKDGRPLHTLPDAHDVFASGVFACVTHSPPLEHAIELLIRAAETTEDDDVTAATEQVVDYEWLPRRGCCDFVTRIYKQLSSERPPAAGIIAEENKNEGRSTYC